MPMTAPFSPSEARLFFALLWSRKDFPFNKLAQLIEEKWGAITGRLEPAYYPMATYYEKEMGLGLKRAYLTVNGTFSRDSLVHAKLWAMEIEQGFAVEGRRKVNIDPGLICKEQMLLISTKPYSHRIFVRDNLYIELTYQFEKGEFKILPWTYPDYREKEVIEFFQRER